MTPQPMRTRHYVAAVALTAMCTLSTSARSQSLLDRSPNVSGDWVGASGSLYFNFIHRFSTSGPPERKVTNVPTFLVGAGLPYHLFAGVNYSTNSTLAPNYPNEWELFARFSPISQDLGAPVDVGGQIGYNNAAQGVDGEVSVARKMGILRLLAAGRALSDPLTSGRQRFALAGGATIRLGTYVALAGDVASLTNRDSSERVAWSAGVHVAIPLTPHTLSIQVTNTLAGTLQGVSRGTSQRRYGFEFTIPLTLARYFGKRTPASTEADSITASDQRDSSAAAGVATPSPTVDSLASKTNPPSPRSSTSAPPATESTSSRTTTSSSSMETAAPKTPAKSAAVTATSRAADALPGTGKIVRNGMKNFAFMQPRLVIEAGTTVVWTNTDALAHTVTADNKSFNSGLVYPGKTYRHTFNKRGTYTYACMPHPFMHGTVIVK
jgi:plastocyanin